MKKILLLLTHAICVVIGFAGGIYLLPILVATPEPPTAVLAGIEGQARLAGTFTRELKGSDALHWGEGDIMVGTDRVAHRGTLAPGPDYRLYLSTEFVEDEASFVAARASMIEIGPVRGFDGFVLPVPAGVNVDDYAAAIVWCEAFGEFITAARLQPR